jgi:class 3 adenylate cyclase
MTVLPFLLIIFLYFQESVTPTKMIVLCTGIILFSILSGFILLRESSDQLQDLASQTGDKQKSVTGFNSKSTDSEIQSIALNFNNLLGSLNRAELDIQTQSIQLLKYANDLSESYARIEKEKRVRDHLCRYLDKELVEKLMSGNDTKLMKSQRRCLTVMFADIRSFTSISEHMDPEAVINMLNEFFEIMVEIIFTHQGMLDKFAGDQIMAVFGHVSSERHGARSAVRAAFDMQRATEALMQRRGKNGSPVFEVGIGINTGDAIIGNLGSENRMDYTVIGDTVNAAARLENQASGGEIVIGEQTYLQLPKQVHTNPPIKIQVKNRSEPLTCYSIRKKPNKK